jgi:hypothetical protein
MKYIREQDKGKQPCDNFVTCETMFGDYGSPLPHECFEKDSMGKSKYWKVGRVAYGTKLLI